MPRHTPNSHGSCWSCPTALGACSHLQATQGLVLLGSTRMAQPSWHGRTPAPQCPFSLESSFSKSDLFHPWFPPDSCSNHPQARDYACQRTWHYLPVPENRLDKTQHKRCPCPMELSPCPARCPVPLGASWAPGDNQVATCPPAEQANPNPNTVPVEQPAEQDPGAIPTVAGCFPTSPRAFDCSFTPCSQ